MSRKYERLAEAAEDARIENAAGERTGKKGRPRGTTKMAKLRERWTAEGFLEFINEYELRLWCIETARRRKDYQFVHRALEDLADRARGKPAQQFQHSGPGGGVVQIRIERNGHPSEAVQSLLSGSGGNGG
jgi:hypothetical protein